MEKISFRSNKVNNQINTPSAGKAKALATTTGFSILNILIKQPIVDKFKKINNSTSNEQDALLKGITEAFKETKLADKNTELFIISDNNLNFTNNVKNIKTLKSSDKKIPKIFLKEIEKLPTIIKNKMKNKANKIANTIIEGKNACYLQKTNKIISSDKLLISLFHEMGHALNYNFGTFSKLLHKTRKVSELTILPISILSIFFRNTEPKNNEELSTTKKVINTIRNNSGKIALFAMAPMVLEETIASIKGNKLAKKFLSADLAKKVKKANTLAGLTYTCTAITTALGLKYAVKIKDKAQAKADEKYLANK